MAGGRARLTVLVVVALIAFPGTVAAEPRGDSHCVTPAGDDLNETFGVREAFIAPFCTEMDTGDRWRAVLRVVAAGADYVFPAGYEPALTPLDDDFVAKIVSVRFVVDAGTRRARTYEFAADDLLIEQGGLPDGSRFVRWVTPALHPLPPGRHTVDEYVTLAADFWDGFDVVPELNAVPAGESLAGTVEFTVARAGKG